MNLARLINAVLKLGTSATWDPVTLDGTITGARALYVGGAGNVSAVDAAGNTRIFYGVAAGTTLNIAPVRVTTANTSASNMLVLK